MLIAAILYIAGIIALLQGVPAALDPRTVMDQTYAGVHIIGGLLMIGVGFALHRQNRIMEKIGVIKKKEKVKVNIIDNEEKEKT
jgi:uncharacterized membrane protein YqgA involved in biofilm formation